MEQLTNSLGTSIFAFQYESRGSAIDGNHAIEKVFESQIVPGLAEVIDANIPQNTLIELDTLEIDIGHIDADDLQTELAQRVKKAFEAALHGQLVLKPQGGLADDFPPMAAPDTYVLSALQHYLEKGYLPKWLGFKASEETLSTLLEGSPKSELIALLKKYQGNNRAMTRLFSGMRASTFMVLVNQLLPTATTAILGLRDVLDRLLDKTDHGGTTSPNRMVPVHRALFTHMLNAASGRFEKEYFYEKVLRSFLKATELSPRQAITALGALQRNDKTNSLVNTIRERLKNIGPPSEREWDGLLSDTKEITIPTAQRAFVDSNESFAASASKGENSPEKEQGTRSALFALQHYLENGFMPQWVANAKPEQVLMGLLERIPSSGLIALLKTYQTDEKVIDRLLLGMEPQVFGVLLEKLLPMAAQEIFGFTTVLVDAVGQGKKDGSTKAAFLTLYRSVLHRLLQTTAQGFDLDRFYQHVLRSFLKETGIAPEAIVAALPIPKGDGEGNRAILPNAEAEKDSDVEMTFPKQDEAAEFNELITAIERSDMVAMVGNKDAEMAFLDVAEADKTAFEEVLQNTPSGTNSLLKEALRTYLENGYLPKTLGTLDARAGLFFILERMPKHDLVALLENYQTDNKAITRLLTGMDANSFELLVEKIAPDAKNEVRGVLVLLQHVLGQSSTKSSQLHHMVSRHSILTELLHTTLGGFDNKRFLRKVLTTFLKETTVTAAAVVASLEQMEQQGRIRLISDILKKESKGDGRRPTQDNLDKALNDLISNLNTTPSFDLANSTVDQQQLMLWIKNKPSASIIQQKLDQRGLRNLMYLFFGNQAPKHLSFIARLHMALKLVKGTLVEQKPKSLNALALASVRYAMEMGSNKTDYQELFLQLSALTGVDDSALLESKTIRQFIRDQGELDSKRITTLLKSKEQKDRGKAGLVQNPITGEGPKPQDGPEDYAHGDPYAYPIDQNKRKLVSFYLAHGYMPQAFLDITEADIKALFQELVLAKDPFLAEALRDRSEIAAVLLPRLQRLHEAPLPHMLNTYLQQHFKEAHSFIETALALWESQLDLATRTGQDPLSLKNQITLYALLGAKGAYRPDTLLIWMYSAVVNQLPDSLFEQQSTVDVLRMAEDMIVLPDTIKASEKDQRTSDGIRVESTQEFFHALVDNGIAPTAGEETQLGTRILLKLALYHRNYPVEVAEIVAGNKEKIGGIFAFLKSQLPPNQWKHITATFGTTIDMAARDDLNEVPTPKSSVALQTLVFDTLVVMAHTQNRLRHQIAMLHFYAHRTFLPWWSDHREIRELLAALESMSQPLGNVFYDAVVEVETQTPFFDLLAAHLPPSLLVLWTRILKEDPLLRRQWKESLEKRSAKTNQEKSQPIPLKNRTQEADSSNTQFDQAASPVDQQRLYLEDDETILISMGSEAVAPPKNLVAAYLKLAPYFYIQGLTPLKWRQQVYAYGRWYHQASQDNPDIDFDKTLLEFLKEKLPTIPWEKVLAAIYQKTQQTASDSDKKLFPDGLKRALNLGRTTLGAMGNEVGQGQSPVLPIEPGEEIKVHNAGLIILWPFLARLFGHFSLLSNGVFTNLEHQNRAVYLLQHLVHDSIDFMEYELVLNKVLVGMPVHQHLTPIDELTPEEMQMSQSLIKGLIGNWDKVKNSSRAGIQETFFRREGLLSFHEENNKLTIPKKGVDVLLESIPWNISLIKLKWMEKPLHIEWLKK